MRAWKNFNQGWMQSRIPVGAHTLSKRTVFILPTAQGLYLVAFLIAMLVACINYNLSLGYFLTFFVFAIALGAMHRTHQNLVQLQIEPHHVDAVDAGDTTHLSIHIRNPTRIDKLNIVLSAQAQTHAKKVSQQSLAEQGAASTVFILADSSQTVAVPMARYPRGEHALPWVKISSVYPLGLWRAWSFVRCDLKAMVYPAPQSPLPNIPALNESNHSSIPTAQISHHQGDAVSHIEASDTPNLKQIHWPSFAKNQLAVKHLESSESAHSQAVVLSLNHCTVQGLEAKLSQLSYAIRHCAQTGTPFALQLSHSLDTHDTVSAACDASHVERCLTQLARYADT